MIVMAKHKKGWAKTLYDLRKAAGLSQSEAAERLEIPAATLRNWEQGRTLPPVYVRRMVERLLKK